MVLSLLSLPLPRPSDLRLNHDLRQRRSVVSAFVAHTQEVCGLAWSPDGTTLASGGNENLLCLWDAAASAAAATASSSSGGGNNGAGTVVRPRATFTEHVAAVKAIAWCPWQRHTLATGGGTADRTIRLWNAAVGTNLRSVDTGSQVGRERRARRHSLTLHRTSLTSPVPWLLRWWCVCVQVCAIQWSDTHKELVSSHGFSDNQLILWKHSTMAKLKEFRGHSSRVLHLAKSPDGETIVSAGADETLRFWPIFGAGGGTGKGKGQSPSRSPAAGRKRSYDGAGDAGPCPSPLVGVSLNLR